MKKTLFSMGAGAALVIAGALVVRSFRRGRWSHVRTLWDATRSNGAEEAKPTGTTVPGSGA